LAWRPRIERGFVRFRVTEDLPLDDSEAVRSAVERTQPRITLRVDDNGEWRLG
jgi:L-alanine-DL-glutamate epimerase-like enolase superfamily enzyme